jgi:hypothetical protein
MLEQDIQGNLNVVKSQLNYLLQIIHDDEIENNYPLIAYLSTNMV